MTKKARKTVINDPTVVNKRKHHRIDETDQGRGKVVDVDLLGQRMIRPTTPNQMPIARSAVTVFCRSST